MPTIEERLDKITTTLEALARRDEEREKAQAQRGEDFDKRMAALERRDEVFDKRMDALAARMEALTARHEALSESVEMMAQSWFRNRKNEG
jgi:chromosome segregation ATPase